MGETVLDYNELALRGVCVCNSDKRLVSVQIYRVLVILGKMLFVEKTVAFLGFLTFCYLNCDVLFCVLWIYPKLYVVRFVKPVCASGIGCSVEI